MPSRNVCVTASCAACGGPLPDGRARRWCSDACRQAAWRRRHQPEQAPPELPARRPLRAGTVYECPECESRLVGAQFCEDCRSFMRRVGPGGNCPHCDEPVALEELVHG
jgi:hypothetical protein